MPNIEIHGITEITAVNNLPGLIFSMFSGKSYIDEIVVTTCPTVVVDKDHVSQPFIRLVTPPEEHTEEILEKLQELGMDVEHLELKAFYPKLACKADGCGGELDFSVRVPLVGTSRIDIAFACKKCKRVYREDGSQVLSHGTHEVFFKNGRLVKGEKVDKTK